METKGKLYEITAAALNADFRSILHAIATAVGISITPTCPLDLRRLVVNLENSRALKGKLMAVTLTDSGIICVR